MYYLVPICTDAIHSIVFELQFRLDHESRILYRISHPHVLFSLAPEITKRERESCRRERVERFYYKVENGENYAEETSRERVILSKNYQKEKALGRGGDGGGERGKVEMWYKQKLERQRVTENREAKIETKE